MTKQNNLGELINKLSARIEDDEKFCTEEYALVYEYCESHNYQLSETDLKIIRSIGLQDSLDTWIEQHQIYGLSFEQARNRNDYKFSLNEISELIQDIRNGYMADTSPNGDPYRAAATLEIGHVDVEVNIMTYEQAGNLLKGKYPIIQYFTCLKLGNADNDWVSDDYIDWEINVDWEADNWMYLLEKDMFEALNHYVIKHHLSYDEPNEFPKYNVMSAM